jgi:hypothetical protein
MKIGAVFGIKYFTQLRNFPITPGKKVPATAENIFLKKSRKKERFSRPGNPALLPPENRALRLYVPDTNNTCANSLAF